MADHPYDFEVEDWEGRSASLDRYRDHGLLIVNVASQCGFTPQYAGLESLHRRYRDRRFSVLGFPCNQFGGQEPGSNADVHRFCRDTYDVTFPLFGKIEVNGPSAHPLFVWLKAEHPGVLGTEAIKWNFTKFLIDRAGRVTGRFGSRTTPDAMAPRIEALLG